jgi:2Fe-2S ferredoxin
MGQDSAEHLNLRVVDSEGEEQSVLWQPGESLMEALRDNGLPVLASCGGVCACATCHVYIDESLRSRLGTRSECENELLSAAGGFQPEVSRLSCQIPYDENLNGITVTLPGD